jgi:hydroxysqualene synthase
MSEASALSSGKGHHDENFPVASYFISSKHRPAILAFYYFVRAADDVADNPVAMPSEKLRILEGMRASLMGESGISPEGAALSKVLQARGLSPVHAADLLEAFRRDVTKQRYANWDELMDYCRYSAMPVGRFVLDVHGESRELWPLNDALCAALQVINHLQDCAKDYRTLDRVYLPLDTLRRHGAKPELLASLRAAPELRAALAELASHNTAQLEKSAAFARQIKDVRLGLEVSAIQTLAEDLNEKLLVRDPLSERVHHSKPETAGLLILAVLRFFGARFGIVR